MEYKLFEGATALKLWTCYYKGKEIAVIPASDELDAIMQFEARYPKYDVDSQNFDIKECTGKEKALESLEEELDYDLDEAKKKKKPYTSMTITTGNIDANLKHFNKCMGTDFTNPSTAEAKAAAEAATSSVTGGVSTGGGTGSGDNAGGDAGNTGGEGAMSSGEGGGMGESLELKESSWTFESKLFDDGYYVECRWDKYAGFEVISGWQRSDGVIADDYHKSYSSKESALKAYNKLYKAHEATISTNTLTEAKRYVRRYYIRPQNIFCSNKTDIIKALIDIEDQNCTIYTLNNLGDEKDVTKLTTKDIIYYYDDGILYDKNRVKVMDYDLYIKHEEDRDSINPDTASDAKFADVYEDRITGMENDSDVYENLNLKDNNATLTEDIFPKSLSRLVDTFDGVELEYRGRNKYFVEVSDPKVKIKVWNAVCALNPANADLRRTGVYVVFDGQSIIEGCENAFSLDFNDINVFGENLVEGKISGGTCCICGEEIEGYGNNADPYKDGRCCDACNIKFVIPARLAALEDAE